MAFDKFFGAEVIYSCVIGSIICGVEGAFHVSAKHVIAHLDIGGDIRLFHTCAASVTEFFALGGFFSAFGAGDVYFKLYAAFIAENVIVAVFGVAILAYYHKAFSLV